MWMELRSATKNQKKSKFSIEVCSQMILPKKKIKKEKQTVRGGSENKRNYNVEVGVFVLLKT